MHRQQIHTHTHTHTDNCKCNSNKFSSISVFGLCLLSAFSHFLRSSSWKSAALTTVAVFKYLHDFRLLAQLSFKMAVSHTHTHTRARSLSLSLSLFSSPKIAVRCLSLSSLAVGFFYLCLESVDCCCR